MIDTTVSIHIDAPADIVSSLYVDPAQWPRLFPATIRDARVSETRGAETVIEVDHRQEGRVINHLRRVSATRVDLDEWKRRYHATFSNEFAPEADGTRYTLRGRVHLKGAFRLLAPFAGPLVRSRMRRFVLEPLRAAAEREAARRGDRSHPAPRG